MYYSLTFTMNGVTKNTWDDWKMIPNTPPMIPPPEPNLNYIDIPGRSGGPLDLTGKPFNKMTYKRMTGSWTFYREPDNKNTRKDLYNTLIRFFNGKSGKVILEEEPAYFFVGRFTVGVPKTATGPIQFTLGFDLAPVRYYASDGTADPTYGDADVSIYDGGTIPAPWHNLQLEYDEPTADLRISGFD